MQWKFGEPDSEPSNCLWRQIKNSSAGHLCRGAVSPRTRVIQARPVLNMRVTVRCWQERQSGSQLLTNRTEHARVLPCILSEDCRMETRFQRADRLSFTCLRPKFSTRSALYITIACEHRSEWNPVPGGITGPQCSWSI
jgi:hypothetical protein